NTSIHVAAARLVQARALVQSADSQRMPQVGINASGLRGDGFIATNAPPSGGRSLTTLTANISYEADVFGRLAQASNAASLDARSREALLPSTPPIAPAPTPPAPPSFPPPA